LKKKELYPRRIKMSKDNCKKNNKKHIEEVYTVLSGFNYKEKPVDIITFLKDDYYLGKITKNLKAIYPGWIRPITEIFRDDTKYLVVFTGSIGIGKSMVVCGYCMPYILYRIGCLQDPWSHFEKGDAGDMEVSFFNLTKNLSGSRGFAYLQNSLQSSPWFKEHGWMTKGNEPTLELKNFRWVLASPYCRGFGSLGGNVVAGVMDEVDSPNESEGQKKRVLQAYEATVRRFESRFVKDGASLGKLFLVASKQDELSFLEVFVEEMKNSNRVLVFEKAQWEIFPKSYYSGVKFSVMAGDEYTPPKIIESDEKNKYIKEGFRVIDIPIEHKFDVERDSVGALRDLAGVTVKGSRRHKLIPAERFIKACFDETKKDPVSMETIEIGLNDDLELMRFIDIKRIRIDHKNPRCIHVDIGITHDALALACSTVATWMEMDVETAEGTFAKQKVPVIETDFIIRLKAKEGDRIPLHKVRKLILDLKRNGLNIKIVTMDLRLASEDTQQILQKAGIKTDSLSVDRDIRPYLDFKNLLLEQRWICHPHKYLLFELRHLELDRDRNKIDHPDKVKDIEILRDGSTRDIVIEATKDLSDAVVGSVYSAIMTAKQPIKVDDYRKIMTALHPNKKPTGGLPDDWFISNRSKKELGQSVLIPGPIHTSENIDKIKKALTKLQGMKYRRFL
jgi:hypothetical protein